MSLHRLGAVGVSCLAVLGAGGGARAPAFPPAPRDPSAAFQLPPLLQNVLRQRTPARTAYAEFTVTYPAALKTKDVKDPELNVWVEEIRGVQELEEPVIQHHVLQRVDDTVWDSNLGDASGFHRFAYEEVQKWLASDDPLIRGQTEEEHAAQFAEPQNALLYDGKVWLKSGSEVVGQVSSPNHAAGLLGVEPPHDLGTLGLAPAVSSYPWRQTVRGALGIPDRFPILPWASARYGSSVSGDIETIAAEVIDHDRVYRLEWDLDHTRGGQPVRSALFENGAMRFSSVTHLEQFDGRWYPKSTEFFRFDYQGGAQPYLIIDVQNASFDQPWHRREPFTPEDIGIVLGTQLYVEDAYRGAESKFGLGGVMFWDGAEIITADQYIELVYMRGVDPDLSVIEDLAKAYKISPEEYLKRERRIWRRRWEEVYGPYVIPAAKKAEAEDEWDVYVHRFIETHQLCTAGQQRALKLLDQSKRRRDWHLHKYRKEIEQAEREGDARRLRCYRRPVRRIFDKMLKAGLEKLVRNDDVASK